MGSGELLRLPELSGGLVNREHELAKLVTLRKRERHTAAHAVLGLRDVEADVARLRAHEGTHESAREVRHGGICTYLRADAVRQRRDPPERAGRDCCVNLHTQIRDPPHDGENQIVVKIVGIDE